MIQGEIKFLLIYLYIQINKPDENTVYTLCSLQHVSTDSDGHHQVAVEFT
jgi:hypothetical protein